MTTEMEKAGCRMALLCLFAMSSLGGDLDDYSQSISAVRQERISQFYTETLVAGAGKREEKCSDRVVQSREALSASPSLGVEPTVGLGAALLIFLAVGVFASGIARAFLMVSFTR